MKHLALAAIVAAIAWSILVLVWDGGVKPAGTFVAGTLAEAVRQAAAELVCGVEYYPAWSGPLARCTRERGHSGLHEVGSRPVGRQVGRRDGKRV